MTDFPSVPNPQDDRSGRHGASASIWRDGVTTESGARVPTPARLPPLNIYGREVAFSSTSRRCFASSP